MRVDELIESGVCEDVEEVLQMFPLELLDEFEACGPQSRVRDEALRVLGLVEKEGSPGGRRAHRYRYLGG